MNMMGVVAGCKKVLTEAGLRGNTLTELIASASRQMLRDSKDRAEVIEVLRTHGARPDGKRLGPAVDEALRLAKAGKL